MHSLRRRPLIARLVLAWFVWVLGVAVAAPLLNPGASARATMLVCSGAGSLLVSVADADTASGGADGSAVRPMGLDCPLCTLVAPPMAQATPVVQARAPLGPVPWQWRSDPGAARAQAPLPPRGPPSQA